MGKPVSALIHQLPPLKSIAGKTHCVALSSVCSSEQAESTVQIREALSSKRFSIDPAL
ncbi:hypothetical protein [Hydrogenophaga sp.]|uniref:hypothetical protein n=1 Tax=Hydrogenophaga sp. TaxID=1904254 RepID=UPI003F6CFB27